MKPTMRRQHHCYGYPAAPSTLPLVHLRSVAGGAVRALAMDVNGEKSNHQLVPMSPNGWPPATEQ